MIHGKRVIVVLPAYNAARTLEKTYAELPLDVVDEIILVDDASQDATSEVARSLGITTIVHDRNLGYGGNQRGSPHIDAVRIRAPTSPSRWLSRLTTRSSDSSD